MPAASSDVCLRRFEGEIKPPASASAAESECSIAYSRTRGGEDSEEVSTVTVEYVSMVRMVSVVSTVTVEYVSMVRMVSVVSTVTVEYVSRVWYAW